MKPLVKITANILVALAVIFVPILANVKPANALDANSYPENFNPYRGQREAIRNYDAICSGIAEKYAVLTWVSPRGDPGNPGPINIASGQQVVQLQFNVGVFLCQDHVFVDCSRTYPGLPCDGNARSNVSLRQTYFYVSGTGVSPDGTLEPGGAPRGGEIEVGYNAGSRYWFGAPGRLDFDYRAPAPMTASKTIDVRLDIAAVNHFASGAYICVANGAAGVRTPAYNCPIEPRTFSLRLEVPSPNSPIGNIDAANCSIVGGWAFDRDDSNQSIEIHIYVDGTGYNYGPTNGFRGDVNAAYGISGNHGFTWPWPGIYTDGNVHSVDVYAINIGSGSNTHLGNRSVGPCLNFTQTIDVNGPSVVEPGDSFTISALVRNNGPTQSNFFQAAVYGDPAALASVTHTNPDGTQSGNRYIYWSGPGLPAGGTSQKLLNFTVSNSIKSNTTICFTGHVNPRAWNDNSNYADVHCVTIVVPRKPYQSTKGGDAHSGMQLSTDATSLGCANPPSAASLNGRIIGQLLDATHSSRGQYALSATGAINNYGSYHRSSSDASGALLTFGNNPTRGDLGSRRVLCRPDYMKLTPAATISSATTSQNVSTMANAYDGQVVLWQGTNTKTITGGVIQPRRHLTILSEGPILIDGDIRNVAAIDDPVYANDIDNIPTIMIVSASNIAIHPNVVRLDGWYVANGTFSTCSTDPTSDGTMRTSPTIYNSAAGTSTCGNQLYIYGMLEANNIFWRRTHGDVVNAGGNDTATNQAGEIILFSPELYLALPPGLQVSGAAATAEYDSERPPLN